MPTRTIAEVSAQQQFHVGLAYSNIQQNYNIPTIVAGVLIDAEKLRNLSSTLFPLKDRLLARVNSLGGLLSTFEDIRDFLEDFKTIEISNKKFSATSICFGYRCLLQQLFEDNLLQYISKIRKITYRELIEVPGFSRSHVDDETMTLFSRYTNDIVRMNEEDLDLPMQVSRLLARLEYEQMRQTNSEYISEEVFRTSKEHFQFFRLAYCAVDLDEFVDGKISPPELMIRSHLSSIIRVPLRCGLPIKLVPLARFCRGQRDPFGEYVSCSGTDETHPYGRIAHLSGRERCEICARHTSYLNCMQRKPRCDGLKVVCGNKEFAGSVCNSAFGLYVTMYGRIMKVGTSLLHNMIARLQEQGASSALLVYPVMNIARKHALEIEMKNLLDREFKNDARVSTVTLTVPRLEDKVTIFLREWDDDRYSSIYLQVNDILSKCILDLREFGKAELGRTERKIVNLKLNYQKPTEGHFEPMLILPNAEISGRVLGYRGSLIFLDSGQAVDFKRLQGFVCVGNVDG